ncbi:ABC transporter ATP-binding protein [Marivita sp. S2033]|uniref:ABC transporter ATP-binding protein n=1 Tax=Marivita sp. S2033 TaxID=3373187 RepID=UPI003981F715
MPAMVQINEVSKTYADGFCALNSVSLDIEDGEILALLGPNGAGKTTLISTICGITRASSGDIHVGGYDVVEEYRGSRSLVGLVPQEINLEPFERVMNTVKFSRGLFGKAKNDALLEKILRQLSLWDKRDSRIMELSGGMKRRVLIAKALAHEPRVLFLDEPTAGVDVELRRDMWDIVAQLKRDGVTIILTTHYIEEAEAIADRIAVINKGEILLVEAKDALMTRLGQKELRIELQQPINAIPESMTGRGLRLEEDGLVLVYTYDATQDRTGMASLIGDLSAAGLVLRDLQTRQNSLEDIFVGLVSDQEDAA